jgi:hypothetical protein
MTAQDWATIGRGLAAILLVVAAVFALAFLLGGLQGTITGSFG